MKPVPTRRRGAVCVLLASLASVAGAGAWAQGIRALNGTAISYFSQADLKTMHDNAEKVLAASEPHAKSAWSNPKSGNSGEAEVMNAFESAGMSCKRLRVANAAEKQNVKGEATYSLCNYPGKGWRVQAGGR